MKEAAFENKFKVDVQRDEFGQVVSVQHQEKNDPLLTDKQKKEAAEREEKKKAARRVSCVAEGGGRTFRCDQHRSEPLDPFTTLASNNSTVAHSFIIHHFSLLLSYLLNSIPLIFKNFKHFHKSFQVSLFSVSPFLPVTSARHTHTPTPSSYQCSLSSNITDLSFMLPFPVPAHITQYKITLPKVEVPVKWYKKFMNLD